MWPRGVSPAEAKEAIAHSQSDRPIHVIDKARVAPGEGEALAIERPLTRPSPRRAGRGGRFPLATSTEGEAR